MSNNNTANPGFANNLTLLNFIAKGDKTPDPQFLKNQTQIPGETLTAIVDKIIAEKQKTAEKNVEEALIAATEAYRELEALKKEFNQKIQGKEKEINTKLQNVLNQVSDIQGYRAQLNALIQSSEKNTNVQEDSGNAFLEDNGFVVAPQ